MTEVTSERTLESYAAAIQKTGWRFMSIGQFDGKTWRAQIAREAENHSNAFQFRSAEADTWQEAMQKVSLEMKKLGSAKKAEPSPSYPDLDAAFRRRLAIDAATDEDEYL